MTLHVKKGTDWKSVYAQARSLAPEAFETDRLNNLIMGEWAAVGTPSTHVNPVDQMPIGGPPKIDHQTAIDAVVDDLVIGGVVEFAEGIIIDPRVAIGGVVAEFGGAFGIDEIEGAVSAFDPIIADDETGASVLEIIA